MFVLFGTKTVKTPVKNGLNLRKRCDRCRLLSDLREHSFRQHFTLFFIPVFPISKGEHMLVCDRCGASFYIQPEDHLSAQIESPFYSASAAKMSSAPDAEKMVIVCDYCQGRLRIPMTGRRLLVTCPHCKREFEV
ncbi:MAG: zinc-ribbon domain-containing protein [Blastocatellia bacterium]